MAQRLSGLILVIDDDEESLLLSRKILVGSGYSVEQSSTIQSGLEKARMLAPHLIILSLMMGRGSGFRFLTMRRQQNDLKSLPVLVLGSSQKKNIIQRALTLGADDYAAKPIDPRILVQKIRKILRKTSFGSVKFPFASLPRVETHVLGMITTANENGFLLEGPFKIALGARVELSSPLLYELTCSACIFHKTPRPPEAARPGHYRNEITGVGLSPIVVKQIRKIVKTWR